MAFCICIVVHWSGRQLTVILPAMRELQRQIESYYARGVEAVGLPEAGEAFLRFRDALTAGTIRAAEKVDGAGDCTDALTRSYEGNFLASTIAATP